MTTQQRETFDCAYSKLETTIRNFSREKFSLESNIAQQNLTISSLKTDIENLNSDIQKLQIEKNQAENVWKRDEEYRCSVEAAIIESEKKIDAYYMSLSQFESIAQSITGYIETFENVMQNCKYRQVELLDHIFTTEEVHLAEKSEFQDKIRFLEKQLATNEEGANTKRKEFEETLKKLTSEINELHLSLANQKELFENAAKKHDIFVEDLRSNHTNEILEKDNTLSAAIRKYEEVESALRESLENKNILLEENASRIATLEEHVSKLKSSIVDWENKFEDTCINHKKFVEDLRSCHANEILEKDTTLSAATQKYDEVESALRESLKNKDILLEENASQIATLDENVNKLNSSIADWENKFEDASINHKKFVDDLRSNHLNEILEKDSTLSAAIQKYGEAESSLRESLKNKDILLEENASQIATLDENVNKLKSSIVDWENKFENTSINHKKFVDDLRSNHANEILEKDNILSAAIRKYEEVESALRESLENKTILLEESASRNANLEEDVSKLKSSITDWENKFEDTSMNHKKFVEDLRFNHANEISEKDTTLSAVTQKYEDVESTLRESLKTKSILLEESASRIADLEENVIKLNSSITDWENKFEDASINHKKTLEQVAQTKQDQIEEKETLVTELQLKFSELEDKMNSSMKAASEELETFCAKVKSLEAEINEKNDSLNKLNAFIADKDDTICSLEFNVEKLKRDIEDHRERAIENYKSFRDASDAKEKAAEMYEGKLQSINAELSATSDELTNLKALYQSRERAITKFMLETKASVPISFQTSQSSVKTPTAAYAIKESQSNSEVKKKSMDSSLEKMKQSNCTVPPKNYEKETATPAKKVMQFRMPSQTKSTVGILKAKTKSSVPEAGDKKTVSFKQPEPTFNFKEYFNFDTSSGNSDLDSVDSPEKSKKLNTYKPKAAVVAPSKATGNKRNAGSVETEKSLPSKKDKPDNTGVVDDHNVETTPIKPSSKKFFRSRKI